MTKRLEKLVECFRKGRECTISGKLASRGIECGGGYVRFWYGRTYIASLHTPTGRLEIRTQRFTATTKNYLNGILAMYGLPQLRQRNWQWYFDGGEEFTGYKCFENVRFAASLS